MIPSQVKDGASAAAMLMERTTRFVKIVALPLGKKSDGLAVKPWVLRGLVCLVVVIWGKGWLPPLMTSRPCPVPWARSCSTGVSIPIAGWGRTVVYRWTGSAVAVRGRSGTTCIVRAPNAEQFSEWT